MYGVEHTSWTVSDWHPHPFFEFLDTANHVAGNIYLNGLMTGV